GPACPEIAVYLDVGVAQPSTRAIGDDSGQGAVLHQQVCLNARCLFELSVDLRGRQLALLERHLVERRLGTLADAERPTRIRLIARPRERVVQPPAEIFRRQHEVEPAIMACQYGDEFM